MPAKDKQNIFIYTHTNVASPNSERTESFYIIFIKLFEHMILNY